VEWEKIIYKQINISGRKQENSEDKMAMLIYEKKDRMALFLLLQEDC